ncbi:MAG: hemerythrin domain-containing protein [Actinomycetota bacterium]
MNVLDLLHTDHETVSKLFAEMLSTPSTRKGRREELFATLKSELIRHSHAEEKVFYPPLREKKQSHDIVEEGIGEHHHVEDMLAQMDAIPADSDDWLDSVQKLKECVDHHVREEEGEIFDDARSLLDEQVLEGMTDQIRQAKRDELSQQ